MPSMCATFRGGARYRASKLASGRNHITVDESPTGLSVSGLFRLIFYCSLPSFRRPPACTRSTARSDDALKLKTLEMGHSRHLFLSRLLPLSPSFFPCSVLRGMPRWKGSRTKRKSRSFRRRMPFKLFIRISRSWGRAMTGRSNECGVKPATRNAENHVPAWSARGNLIVVHQRAGTVRFLERSSMIFGLDLSSGFLPVGPFLHLQRDYAVSFERSLLNIYIPYK